MGKKYVANGMQKIVARDSSTVNPIQINSVGECELEKIIKEIKGESVGLKEEDAESINDVADMVKEELSKPNPKVNRLKNYLTLINSMLLMADKIPVLGKNMRRLADYIMQYIK